MSYIGTYLLKYSGLCFQIVEYFQLAMDSASYPVTLRVLRPVSGKLRQSPHLHLNSYLKF